MKNLISTFAFILFITTGATFAQAGGNLDTRVATVTRSMASHLGLNESDYIKLKALNRENMAKADEIAATYATDDSTREMKIGELRASYDNKLSSFLSPKQMEAYVAYKENKTNYTAFSETE